MPLFYSDYENALKTAQKELAELLNEQKQIEQEILNRRRLISTLLETLKTLKPIPPLTRSQEEVQREITENWFRYTSEQSITDDVRKIIRAAGPMGIGKESLRTELSKLGNSIEAHANPAGTINSIVRRLIDKGEVEEVPDALGFSTVLRWKEPFLTTFGSFGGPPVQR